MRVAHFAGRGQKGSKGNSGKHVESGIQVGRKGANGLFAPYTQIDRCIGKEVTVRMNGENYTGMLAGVYTLHSLSVLVLTPMGGAGMEQHIPLQGGVVTIKHDA
jgi:hypothetical protein